MNAIGMYMTGNSLQIFSIMMVFMLFKTPITAVMNIQNTFARLETEGTREKMWQVKAVFVLCNLMALALGVWKVDKMGLLPYVCSLHLFGVGKGSMLTRAIGRRDRTGLLGRRRGSRWRGLILCGPREDDSTVVSFSASSVSGDPIAMYSFGYLNHTVEIKGIDNTVLF
jgi:hypothetical protein